MLNSFLFDLETKLDKSVDILKNEFSKILVNKINVNLIKSLPIFFHNEKMFLEHISVITVESGNILLIKPFDKSYINIICNEILKLNIDLNPFVIGDSIKVVFPILTMERRQFFVKKVKKISEDIKVSIRNIRKIVNNDVKVFLKTNKISEDEEKKFFLKMQKVVDTYIDKVEFLAKKKENELLNV
jgi:ribosome recycling factor